MAEPCIIKSGETVEVTDSRLNDTGCTIEQGVIIRPPADLSVAVPVEQKPAPKPKPVKAVAQVAIVTRPPEKLEEKTEMPQVQPDAKTEAPKVSAITVQPEPPPKEVETQLDPMTVVSVVTGIVAAVGAVTMTSGFSGGSLLQQKAASLLGSSKATAATAAAVTAGTIVAVKALESKMSKLESDLDKTKKEVNETSASADRIDELLSKLGG